MSPLDSFWSGVLSFLTPIITPDWGKLVTLIPFLLVIVVALFLVVTAVRWGKAVRTAPAVARADKSQKPVAH